MGDYPKADWSWNLQAEVLARPGQLPAALESAREAVRLDPGNSGNQGLLDQIRQAMR